MTAEELASVRSRREAGMADCGIMDRGRLLDHVDALTARLEVAERERDEERTAVVYQYSKTLTQWARAEAAEAKLAALVASVDRVAYQMGPPHSCPRKFAIGQLRSALAAARIKP